MGYRLSLVRSPRMVPESRQLDILATLIEHYTRLGRTLSPAKPISRFARFAEWNLLKKKTLACSSCRNYFAVGHHGEVSSCQMTLDHPLGQSRTDSFSDIVARARSRGDTSALATPTERRGVCSRCTYFHVCAGGCPQHTISVYGTEAVPSAWCKVFGGLVPVYVEAIANQMERRRGYLLASPS
jgi:radical SAM protein with 4Fe4S-binding SPASM domain